MGALPAIDRPPQVRPYASRYELLDGVRGVAALAVVLAHHQVVDFGHEAVMAFFLVSGYCISAAATSRLVPGGDVSVSGFLWRRFRRIYPPYALSLGFFAVTRLLREAMGRGAGPSSDPVAWLQNLTLTQWTTLLWHPLPEPMSNRTLFVAAHWSLNYEEQFYLVVALAICASRANIGRFFGILAFLAIVGACWDLLVAPGLYHGVFLEYWPHFAIGVGLYYALSVGKASLARPAYAMALGALILGCLAFRPTVQRGELGLVVDELAWVAGFGLVLLAIRPYSERLTASAAWRPLHFLGTISYSLYLVHQFNLNLASSIGSALVKSQSLHWLATTIAIGVQLAIATVFWRFCERPFLNKQATP